VLGARRISVRVDWRGSSGGRAQRSGRCSGDTGSPDGCVASGRASAAMSGHGRARCSTWTSRSSRASASPAIAGESTVRNVAGRIVAVLLMFTEIGFISVFTATIASAFVRNDAPHAGAVTAELRRQLTRLEEQLSYVAGQFQDPRRKRVFPACPAKLLGIALLLAFIAASAAAARPRPPSDRFPVAVVYLSPAFSCGGGPDSPPPFPGEGAPSCGVVVCGGSSRRPCPTNELYGVDAVGEPVGRISGVGTDSWSPAWRPGSDSEIACARVDGIYVVSLANRGARLVVSSSEGRVGWPAWSPDASTLVFTGATVASSGAGVTAIYSVAADGSDLRLLRAEEGGAFDTSPVYSHDGSSIAFARWTPGVGGSIWVMRADGTAAHELARLPGYASGLAWNSSGELAVSVVPAPLSMDDATRTNWEAVAGIYTLHDDGADLRRIIPDAIDRPVWLADERLLFAYASGASDPSFFGFYTASAEGGDIKLFSSVLGVEPAVRP
jgi:WD40-like Beta Propeller Repeat